MRRRRTTWSLGTWAALAAGTAATIGSAAIGLHMLQRSTHVDLEEIGYFLRDRQVTASVADTEVFSSTHVGYGAEPPRITA